MATPNVAPQEQAPALPVAVAQSTPALAESIVFYGTFSLLFFAPLAFGSADPWSTLVLQLGAAALLLIWIFRHIRSGTLHIAPHPLFRPILCFGLLVGLQIVFGLTAYRYQTISETLLYMAYGCLLFLAVQAVQRTSQVKLLAWTVSAYGTGVALFALLQSLSSNGKIYWLWQPETGGWIYGPYVNHNHYAGLMEMLFPIPMVMALTQHIARRWRPLPIFAAVLMAATIFLSGSRGGMIAFLAQMIALGIVIGLKQSRRTAFGAGVVLVVVAVLLVWIGGEGLIDRLTSIHREAKTEIAGGTRLAIDRDGLKMFARKPLLGWGLGAFPVVYPQFRSFYSDKFVNRAHDDYLQLLVEMGLLGFAMMMWFVALTIRGAIRKLGDWKWDFNGAVALAALLGCIGILVHSLLDFNLHVPANAAWFYVLCGIAAADTKFGAHRRRRHRRHKSALSETPLSN